jgi:RNA polymerase sigma-70 factor (ECF subfamily)
MKPHPLDLLLDKLSGGDAEAGEEAFRAFEPYLRKVVRRQLPTRLRAKFDSADVVQSVWADVIQGLRAAEWQFADRDHLRAFLVKVTRNRLIDRCRKHGRVLAHEQAMTDTDLEGLPTLHQPRPSDLAQADDLWARMLELCPPQHHEVLRLKRQGRSPAEIAARTGLHEDSIRRILRKLARQLALKERPLTASDEEG